MHIAQYPPAPQTRARTLARQISAVVTTLALSLSALLITSSPAAAAQFTVMNTDDDGVGSLRQAIISANSDPGADEITFDASVTGTVSLASSLPAITAPLTITGPGIASLTIDGNGHSVFAINGSNIAVSISGLTITDAGQLSTVAAIENSGGPLTLTNISVTNSHRGLWHNSGHITATNVSITGSTEYGAVLELSTGASTLTDVTVNGNTWEGLTAYLDGDATLTATGIEANDASSGMGILVEAEDSSRVDFTDTEANGNGLVSSYEGVFIRLWDDAQAHFTNTTANGNGADGIGIDLDNRSIATFTNTTANGNWSDGFEGNAFKHAQLTLVNTTTTGNDADGIDVSASTGADVIVETATVSSNYDNGLELGARGDGGPGNDASLVTVSGVHSEDNYRGAEIDASHAGIVQVSSSTFTDNEQRGILIDSDSKDGTDSQVHVVDSTISDNGVGSENGAGIAIVRTSSLSVFVIGSTVSTNLGDEGGGIYGRLAGENPTEVTIANSTISGNSAEIGGGMYLRSNSGAPITVHSSTIMGNITSGDFVPSDAAVYLQGVEASFRDTILAGAPTTDVSISDGTVATFHYSLIETSNLSVDSLVNEPANHNLVGVDPQLTPLGSNGGATATHLPASTSPVLNAGDPAWANPFLTTDQRGEARVSGGRIDIGAVEVPAALASTGVGSVWLLVTLGLALTFSGGALLASRRTSALTRGAWNSR